jgi:hypothetical protein
MVLSEVTVLFRKRKLTALACGDEDETIRDMTAPKSARFAESKTLAYSFNSAGNNEQKRSDARNIFAHSVGLHSCSVNRSANPSSRFYHRTFTLG